MPITVENLDLDETNIEFNYASDFVKHTDRLVYVTGKAGTGKTTFLKYLRETTTKNTVILAPTVYSVHVDPPFWDVDPPAKQAIRVRA
jgi:tRNA A37 threonylcarbamoyladenosine biosynthesis protein TsaE